VARDVTLQLGDINDHLILQGDAVRIPLPDLSVNLTIGSPPYRKARHYLEGGKNLGIARDTEEWIDWMLVVTAEALRVTNGPVVWVAWGSTEDRNYHPICEGLMYRWWQSGGHAYRPCYWHRVGIPGSGGDDWFRADVEYVMCFKRPGELPWSDNTAMGHPPKWAPGGDLSYRTPKCGPNGYANGDLRERRHWTQPELCNPGNLVRTLVGGGQLGHELAHENEAPYPVDVPEWFIRSLCPPGGLVLDPFHGSGTTTEAALKHGRRAIGLDLRRSQCLNTRQRITRPHAPVMKSSRAKVDAQPLPLFRDEGGGT
jgi:DNA modification methylase